VRLTVVQAGTAAQGRGPGGSCFLLTLDVGRAARHVIVDLGPGSLDRLAAARVDLRDVAAIFLTHLHPDHAAELASAIQTMIYGLKEPRTDPLVIVGGPGIKGFVESLARWQGAWIVGKPDRFEIRIDEMSPGDREKVSLGGTELPFSVGRVAHSDSSVAFRFHVGQDLVLTGDTGPCESLVEFAQGAGCLVTECSFPDTSPISGHMTPSALSDLAMRSKVSRLILGHFYPAMDPAAALDQVGRAFPGTVLPALPGLEIMI